MKSDQLWAGYYHHLQRNRRKILAKLWVDCYFLPSHTVYFRPMGAVNNQSAFIKVQNFISIKFYHLLWKWQIRTQPVTEMNFAQQIHCLLLCPHWNGCEGTNSNPATREALVVLEREHHGSAFHFDPRTRTGSDFFLYQKAPITTYPNSATG